MEVSGILHTPDALPSGKRSGTHRLGSWVDLKRRSGRFGEEKNVLLQPGFKPRTLQTFCLFRLTVGQKKKNLRIGLYQY
jgi:hypothetical protein